MTQILFDPITLRIGLMAVLSVGAFVLLVAPFVREG